jgi:outer membrane protein assembly factor BamB
MDNPSRTTGGTLSRRLANRSAPEQALSTIRRVRRGLISARSLLAVPVALIVMACGAHTARSASRAQAPTPGLASGPVSSGDWPSFDYDNARTGAAPDPGINAGNAGRLSLRTVRIDGVADSAAIELHAVKVDGRRRDVAILTTTYGKTVAIDSGTGAHLWEFVPSGVNSSPGNPQVTTASPVVDPDRRFVYSTAPNGLVYKLSVASGHVAWARSVTFDPRHEKLASALAISGGSVVVVTSGYYGDVPPYDGHVVMISRSSGHISAVWNTECSNRHRLIPASSCGGTANRGDNAIWGRAGAVIEPGSRRILVATGNGPFNGRTSWGDSVLELSANAGHLLHNWTPSNQAQLSGSDTDLGSASPALLPTYAGFHLVVQAAKDGLLHLLNLRRLDGTRGGAAPRLGGELDQVSSPGGSQVLTQPLAARVGRRILVFVADDSGTAAYQLVGGHHPRLSAVWQNGTPGTSPVLSGGLLYVYDELDGRLLVRRPASGGALRSLPVAGGHWNSPIVASGRIIVPTGSYHSSAASSIVEIYHLPGR